MTKLTEENQRILKRIQEVPPAYNHMQWEDEADRLDRLKRTMALYPEYYEKLDREKERERIKALNEGAVSSPTYGGESSQKLSASKSAISLPKIKQPKSKWSYATYKYVVF